VAIVGVDGEVLFCESQHQNSAHAPFGGVVPEIASRNHTVELHPLIDRALETTGLQPRDLLGFAVTSRPGLVGSLLVGLVSVKTLALVHQLPFVAVHHLEGHIFSSLLWDKSYKPPEGFGPPFVALTVSGGHTSLFEVKDFGSYRLLGQTVDDAAGEALDKFAKMLGLGFPGGAAVDKAAKEGDPAKYHFPRGLDKEEGLRMSFSGLKTSALRWIESHSLEEVRRELPHLCASYQEAVVDSLLIKLDRAVDEANLDRVVISGGVSANSRLREKATKWAQNRNLQLVIPPLRYCTDNAAMIGIAGARRLIKRGGDSQDVGPMPRAPLEEESW
jgi:N6-L-threonylcarbamoyladenine synthase